VTTSPPQAESVQVVPARPTDADRAVIAHLNQVSGRDLDPVTYLVLIRLRSVPAATGSGHALLVGDHRVPAYWEYRDGVYFTVHDPQFFTEHAGQALRFATPGGEATDTGLTLPRPAGRRRGAQPPELRDQREILGRS
jgi:hypothetical protein